MLSRRRTRLSGDTAASLASLRDPNEYDFHVQIVNLMQSKEGSETGVPLAVALAILQAELADRCAAHLVVLYPQDYNEIQPSHYTSEYIERQIAARVRGYLSAEGYDESNTRFFTKWRDVLPQIQIQFLTWEAVVVGMGNGDLDRFYTLCKRFNQS